MVRESEGYIELSTLSNDGTPSTSQGYEDRNLSESQVRLILLRIGLISDDDYNSARPIDDVFITRQAEYMLDRIDQLNIKDAITILREALVEHRGDVNFLLEDYRLIEQLVKLIPSDLEAKVHEKIPEVQSEEHIKNRTYLNIVDWNLQVRLEAALIHFHSPYPEVRSITDPYDDPHTPVDTIRAYTIGFAWTFIGSIVNNFFVHRMPSIFLGAHTIQILLLPSGKIWEKYVPEKIIEFWGYSFDLNPGPWTYKEMMLSTIIYLCSAGTPYLVYNIFVMKLDRFYGLKWVTLTYQILLMVSTQFLGFGFALLMKKVCIYPSKALWPTTLPTIALNRALMKEDTSNNSIYGWKISRYSFFYLVFIGSFIYNWIPSFFFKALSTFNWPTWFNPDLIHLNNITGSQSGLGLNPLPTFDWNVIDTSSCLTIPFYTYVNQYVGMVMGFFVILIVYYSNNKWTAYFPINSNKLFNNKGEIYKVHEILDENNAFDNKKYLEVGPPYFSAANLVLYGAYFALYPFAILYNFATEWDSMKTSFVNIWTSITDSFKPALEKHSTYGRYSEDPHCKMMSKYEDVPDWWFLLILLTSTLFAVICVLFYPTETPIWGVFFTILINFIFLIPITSIASVTGYSFGLNVLVELIVGYAIPNSGIALITLKGYGYNIDSQASNYITDQKLAHYSKIPPKAIFKGQLFSTMISVVVALAIANWQLENVPDICDSHQKDKLKCPGANTFFFSSIQYGEIGPAKVFSGLYPVLKWCFLLGALLVIPCAWFKKNGPPKLTRYFQPTIILGGFLFYAPYNILYFTVGLYFSYFFMYYVKKNYILWWEKYNYILTSGLSAGVAFSALVIFFTVQYHQHKIDWWGNTIIDMGYEGALGTWLKAKDAPDGYIGLRKGQFP
ncbi:OPT-domain-containing protein [Suhomyces tanzawaensis NRRL Y-17324]|uniref:OPT-domain-containing protein n=1 Tax=Suhomyces tanzawaensis NRRL Y-17324 TaxID=984487 RepID=A0A1E4SQP4_9ASCO|nr:OPT-domain-containing protein [Suhomyces tanzawaensis NRRL Y-17324]ODV81732.1 OPT-domain-containing protein [Suhomyces tanzawaensis NRRL Y-17324]